MPSDKPRPSTNIMQNPQARVRSIISALRASQVSFKVRTNMRRALLALAFAGFSLSNIGADYEEMAHEQAQFDIYIAGKEIGKEEFLILSSDDSVSTHSTANIRNPADRHQNVRIETELKANGLFQPQDYRLHSTLNGQEGSIVGKFSEGEAMFEFSAGGSPSKRGLLVGDRYIILDTNVFHHFIFVTRLFDFDSSERSQSFEVVVPQELDSGILNVSNIGIEKIQVSGGKMDLHHLKADSGVLLIDLWVDDRGILYKIALPDKQVEVIRH
jgi:hypothetical protein